MFGAHVKLLIASLLLAMLAMAQSGSSVISGTVKDGTGSAVPGAKLKIVNEQSGASQDSLSNDEGLYRVGSLVPGSYRLEVESEGFQKLIRSAVTLEVGQVLALDLTLQLGQTSETVNISESAPVIVS